MGDKLRITDKLRNDEGVSEFLPRNQCDKYVVENSGKLILLTKERFDKFFKDHKFKEGPFIESFGDKSGDPYNPNRQAFGKLWDCRIVYCELSEANQQKVKSYLETLTE